MYLTPFPAYHFSFIELLKNTLPLNDSDVKSDLVLYPFLSLHDAWWKIERIQMIAMNAASIKATSPFTEGGDSNSTSTVKPYKCGLCRYSFTRREHLQRHQALRKSELDLVKYLILTSWPKIVAKGDINVPVAWHSPESKLLFLFWEDELCHLHL